MTTRTATVATFQRGAEGAAHLIRLLSRLLPLAQRLAQSLHFVTRLCLVLTAIIVTALAVIFWPLTLGSATALVLVAAILATPAIFLSLFRRALCEVIGLPDWLRGSPDLVRAHGGELSQLATQAMSRRGQGGGAVVRDSWKAIGMLREAHGDLPDYGRALQLINPFFLLATAVSLVAVLVEVLVAGVAVLGALVSLVF